MAYIKVDHGRLERAAAAADECVGTVRSRMNSIDSGITYLGSSWSGKDYDSVRSEWREMSSDSSTTGNMLRAIDGYADSIRAASRKYREAQRRAINRANTLCK